MESKNSFHMTPDEFRRFGKEMVDWIADYYQEIEEYPVLSQVQPGEIRAGLPEAPPQNGETFNEILDDVENLILPGVTHWQSPNFFAFFPANASGPSILAEMLSAGLGVQGMSWITSPACTELETLMLDWLAEMLDLPGKFWSNTAGGGVIQDTASNATLSALLAARERSTNYRSNEKGTQNNLVVYASTQTHSSMEKAVKIAGMGTNNLRLIEVDEQFSMRPDLLSAQIKADRDSGLIPCFVCATVGTTSSNAIDPVREISEICAREGIWLHVDAAMSGTAALVPEFRHIQDGLELADSYCFNPHKWMFTNFDCDCFYVADRASLIKTFSVLPEYLRNKATESGAVIDYRDWHIQLGRRFRSLKLWFVIRYYGVEGLRYHIRQHVELAQQFASWVTADPDFELVVDPPLNLVCFRHTAGDEVNMQLLESINLSGKAYLTHTILADRYTLRMCVGQTNTEERHVKQAWELIQRSAAKISKERTQ
jgi:aromatic-L-amino-acid decarboxylase